MGKWTALSPDLFSNRAAEVGNMVTERHKKQPQMRGIDSNEAASRIDTIRLAPGFHNCLRTWDSRYVLQTKKIWTDS